MLGVGGSWTRTRQEEGQNRREAGSRELIFILQSVPETGPESEFSGAGRVEEMCPLSQRSEQCFLGGLTNFGPRGCGEICSRRLGSGVGLGSGVRSCHQAS